MKLPYLNKVIVGGWQLADGHSAENSKAFEGGLKVIESYYAAGFRTFDCADIYTGVEALLGTFIKTHGLKNGLGPDDIQVHTKYVPDMASLATLSKADTEAIIDRSRIRLGLDALNLVQFHWWHYPSGDYLAALDSLHSLNQAGKIKAIGLTNFDTPHLQEILDRGIPITSIQTQYSVIDRRATGRLEPLMKSHDIALFCYGSIAGGLLSDAYLGKPQPIEPYDNRSLIKYLLMIEEMGGWEAFQEILEVLRSIADDKDTDIATIASSYCLNQSSVRACIVGARNTKHLAEHLQLRDSIELTESDCKRIDEVRQQFKAIPGDVYTLERDVNGKHGRIMKYNLNKS